MKPRRLCLNQEERKKKKTRNSPLNSFSSSLAVATMLITLAINQINNMIPKMGSTIAKMCSPFVFGSSKRPVID